jgi:RNA recognition motif-containing protein
MAKKSAAQIKRLIKRAEARGETYNPNLAEPDENITEIENEKEKNSNKNDVEHTNISSITGITQSLSSEDIKLKAFLQYQKDLESINSNSELKAKERRSAKRKADAIAIESSKVTTVDELLLWYETYGKQYEEQVEIKRLLKTQEKSQKKKIGDPSNTQATTKKTNPYILFIGQLSYDTTKEDLFQHIQKQLIEEHKVTEQNLQIRMLQDVKTKKSRGMAFVEIKSDDPEFMYSCLKLHRTYLKGRRINVERSAGGGVQTRANKIKQHRMEQEQYIDTTVNAMLEEYFARGEIQRTGELDDGVIQLCKRHSTTVVQAALERYVESNGREMDNSSAYLSFLLTKLAEEGIYNNRDNDNIKDNSRASAKGNGSGKLQKRTSNQSGKDHKPDAKRVKKSPSTTTDNLKGSDFAKQGIDMNVSSTVAGKADILKRIFPTLSRGRGRGRGYM